MEWVSDFIAPGAPDLPLHVGIGLLALSVSVGQYFFRRLFERHESGFRFNLAFLILFVVLGAVGAFIAILNPLSPYADTTKMSKRLAPDPAARDCRTSPTSCDTYTVTVTLQPCFSDILHQDRCLRASVQVYAMPQPREQTAFRDKIENTYPWFSDERITFAPDKRDAANDQAARSGLPTLRFETPAQGAPLRIFTRTAINTQQQQQLQGIIKRLSPNLAANQIDIQTDTAGSSNTAGSGGSGGGPLDDGGWVVIGEFSGFGPTLTLTPRDSTPWPDEAKAAKSFYRLDQAFHSQTLVADSVEVCPTGSGAPPPEDKSGCKARSSPGRLTVQHVVPSEQGDDIWAYVVPRHD